MQGTAYINGEEIEFIGELPEIKAGKIIGGIDLAKGKDMTGMAGKGKITMQPGAERLKLFFDIQRERYLKNIALFRAARFLGK